LSTLERNFDWSETIGLAVDEPGGLWLVQTPLDGAAEYAGFKVARVDRPLEASETLRSLLGRGDRVCHDHKSSGVLRALLDSVTHDTYLGAYLLDPGQRDYRLEALALGSGIKLPVWGGWADSAEAASCGAEVTAAATAVLAVPVAARQAEALRAQGMEDLFETIEMPLTRVLIAMEEAGIHLDTYRLGEIAGKVQDQLEGLEATIFELAGERFNLGSPQQLGRVLFERLSLPRQRKTKTGYSTDAKTLEALRESHPIVEHLLNHRELSKLMSTYLLALPQAVAPGTGRLHTTFHQAVTATGRLSSSDPNLQNIPVRTPLGAQIRQCFTAEAGHKLVVADYSHI
jgi:DNA polymerase-1